MKGTKGEAKSNGIDATVGRSATLANREDLDQKIGHSRVSSTDHSSKKPNHAKKQPKIYVPQAGSKFRIILELLKQPGGTPMSQIVAATGWRAHTIRGVISGIARKKMGLKVDLVDTGNGKRIYTLRQ